jgi:hypothetical protein
VVCERPSTDQGSCALCRKPFLAEVESSLEAIFARARPRGRDLLMKAVTFSEAGSGIFALSVIAAVIWGIAGCGVSYNSTAGKSPAGSAVPIVTCSASPTTVVSGNSAQISTKAMSPLGLPLSYSYGATAGSIASEGTSATLDTEGAAGSVTVTCKVVDTMGNAASSATTVAVQPTESQPPTVSCSANPAAVTLGESVTVTAVASSPEGRPLTYSWSASSGTISGNGNEATMNTSGAAAASITVTCRVADDQGQSASGTTVVTVNAVEEPPPTISCSATPSIINQGGTAVITATGRSPQNLPLTYSYSASGGSISGTSTTASLQTSGASAGVVTVTCTVDQQGGGTASSTTNVLLQSVTGEQALTNFQFTDSVGVNVHLAYGNTVYGSQFPQVMQAMIDLGVKHYRDGLNQYAPSFQYENAEMLGKAGIKADWLMDPDNSASIINSAYVNAPDATAEFEGPNEDDAAAGPALLKFMQLLNNTVRGNPATAAMPIIAPSFSQVSSFATQGSLSSLVNFGNMHDYFQQRNPETAPYGSSFYGCGGYGSMQFNICLAEMVGVNEPVVSTETGYESGVGLSDAIIGRYELRILFESLRLGVARTFLYELIDDPSSGNYGMLTDSFSPRPAYTAIQNVLSLLKDASFAQPGKLGYILGGNTQNVHHLLLQKSDGTFYLAIWLAVASADPNNPSTTYTVAPQDVTLNVNTPIAGATTYILDDNGNMTSSSTQIASDSLSISVTDRITLVSLSLGQSH